MPYDLKQEELFDPTFLNSVVKQMAQLLHPAGCGIYLFYSEKKKLLPAAEYNLPTTPLEPRMLQQVYQTRKLIRQKRTGHASLIAAPLIQFDIALGILVAMDENLDRIFNDQEVDLLLSMADHVALVIQQAKRLSRMTAQFQALHDIDLALTSSLELARVLDLILEKAVDLMRAKGAAKAAIP